jgi:hypothetical protein
MSLEVKALEPTSRPRVGHGFRLQWEAAQNAFVLLYPPTSSARSTCKASRAMCAASSTSPPSNGG